MADLPVVVVHYDAPFWLTASVATIKASVGVAPRVLVVDNSGNAPDLGVETVRPRANLGYSGGANVGLRRWLDGDSEFCVVAAHDLHVEPGTLAALVAHAEAHTQAGLVGPGDTEGEVSWLPGLCLLYRRAAAQQVGLFDEAFDSYCEDVDLSWRVRAAGWGVTRVAAAAHGFGTRSSRAQHMMSVNTMYLQAKHNGMAGLGKAIAATPYNLAREVRAGRWDRVRARFVSFPAGVAKGLSALR